MTITPKTIYWWEIPPHRWRNHPEIKSRMLEREYQQEAAYRADRSLFYNQEGRTRWSGGRVFGSVDEVKTYLAKLIGSAWFNKRWPSMPVTIYGVNVQLSERMGGANACYSNRTIRLGKEILNSQAIILHELAHLLTPPSSGGGHGRLWVRTYLELVQHELGPEWHFKLMTAFKREGVKWRPKMRLSDAERARRKAQFMKLLEKSNAS